MEFGSFMEFHIQEGKSQADAFQEAFAHVDMAEELGLDGVWLAEHHFTPTRSVLSAPLIIASAIAGRTTRIKIGTAVNVLPLGNPLRIAEEASTLDHVSQGRLEFGVGRSSVPISYQGYNIPYGESQERFYEFLEIIIRAWSNESFSYEGKYYSFHDVCLVRKPYQKPHPPIRIAATTAETFPIIGQMGFPVFIGLRSQGTTEVAEQVRAYKQAWEEAGHQGPIDVFLRVPVYVAETKGQALSEPQESFMGQIRRRASQLTKSADTPGTDPKDQRAERLANLTWDQIVREKVVLGTPEMVVDRLREMKDTLHLSGVLAEFHPDDPIPREQVARSLRLFCDKVVPAFK